MKTIIIHEFEDNEIELLKNVKQLPNNPCLTCYTAEKRDCDNCPNMQEYTKEIKPYKKAGIFHVAETMKCLYSDLNTTLHKIEINANKIAVFTDKYPQLKECLDIQDWVDTCKQRIEDIQHLVSDKS